VVDAGCEVVVEGSECVAPAAPADRLKLKVAVPITATALARST
jgi:hypothetical protein